MTAIRPWELVTNEDYFLKVLRNMGDRANDAGAKKPDVRVQFGKAPDAKGISPNYQIKTPRGTTRFRGINHEEWKGEPDQSFNPDHLSGEFTYTDVMLMFVVLAGKAMLDFATP
jgi:hypothetical protein